MSLMALAYLNGGKRGTAVKTLAKIPEWGQIAQTMYKAFISEALKSSDSEKAENLYSLVCSRCHPSPELTGLMLMNYGKVIIAEFQYFIFKLYLQFRLVELS